MSKDINQAEAVTNEENEALALEGVGRVSEEGMELLNRYLEINREMGTLQAEKDAIADLIKGEMKSKGVRALTYLGRTVVELVHSTNTNADIASIRRFFPEIAAKFIHTKEVIRFDVKK